MTGYRFSIPYSVRIADINYAEHVSNAAVLNYFQDARIAYLSALGPFAERDIGEGCGIVLAEVRVRYQAEMFLGDALEIGVRASEVRSRSFVLECRIERGAAACAEGTTAVVCFDYAQRRARTLPRGFRDALAGYEGLKVA